MPPAVSSLLACARRLPSRGSAGQPIPAAPCLAPLACTEQVAPDRPTAIQLGVPLARRGARRAALVSAHLLALRPLIVFPFLHRSSRDRGPRCLAVKARRAVSSASACGPHQPCASSLTARPRGPGFSRAMNSGKTAANRDRPRSMRRINESHNGLRIWESGELSEPQERAYAKTQAMR